MGIDSQKATQGQPKTIPRPGRVKSGSVWRNANHGPCFGHMQNSRVMSCTFAQPQRQNVGASVVCRSCLLSFMLFFFLSVWGVSQDLRLLPSSPVWPRPIADLWFCSFVLSFRHSPSSSLPFLFPRVSLAAGRAGSELHLAWCPACLASSLPTPDLCLFFVLFSFFSLLCLFFLFFHPIRSLRNFPPLVTSEDRVDSAKPPRDKTIG